MIIKGVKKVDIRVLGLDQDPIRYDEIKPKDQISYQVVASSSYSSFAPGRQISQSPIVTQPDALLVEVTQITHYKTAKKLLTQEGL